VYLAFIWKNWQPNNYCSLIYLSSNRNYLSQQLFWLIKACYLALLLRLSFWILIVFIVYAESISWATLLDCKYITWLRGPLLPFYNGKQNYSFDCFISLCSILILVILLIFKSLLLFGFQSIKVIANQCVSSQVSELCCYVDLAVLAAAVNITTKTAKR